jgi:ABC-type cobalamin transport system permease subunit
MKLPGEMSTKCKDQQYFEEFADLSGLRANPSKSHVFCAGVCGRQKEMLIESLEMKEGSLPVRYLGVPLISKKLSSLDCEILLDKISRRMNSWLSRHLYFAGRLQILSSALYSIQIYWSNTFILTKKVIRLIEQKFNRFLWNGSDASAAKEKVSWDDLCVPMLEGGLGLRKIEN